METFIIIFFIVIFGFLFWYISHSEDTQNSRDFTTDGYPYPPKPPYVPRPGTKANNTMEIEIKFRAKSKATNKFIYGIPIKTHIGTYMVYEENPHVCSMYGYMEIDEFELIDEKTIGQFTGLKDKNGIEIYEGDIIEHYNCHQDWETGEIEFKLEQFIVKFEEGSFGVYGTIPDAKYLSEILGCEVSELSEEELEYVGLKVIGNIYDTPELIDE